MFRRSRKAEQGSQTEPPILTVHFGDMHVGSSVALSPPEVQLDDGNWHRAGDLELWYWECWLRFWADTERLKKKYGAHVVAVCGGDERDGDHHATIQLWSASEADQDRAVMETLQVAAEVADEWVFVRGTPAHTGPGAAATERYARWAAALGWEVIRPPGETPRYSHWCWTGELAGVKFEVAHAPSTKGWKPHTQGPAAARQAFETWHQYSRAGKPAPDVVIRHHVHYAAGPGTHLRTSAFIIPAWQAETDHISSKGVTSALQVQQPGGLRLLCQDGQWQKFWKLYEPRSSVAWCQT
jgi:hypothetical protein